MNLDRVEKYTPEMLSVVRIVIALLFLEHGSAKLLGFPPSPHGEPAFMTLMWIQGLIELFGGALLALGLFTRPVAFILSGNMAVAYFMGHASKGFFPLINGGDAGPRRHNAIILDTRSGGPANSASTLPSRRLRTHPSSPRALACCSTQYR